MIVAFLTKPAALAVIRYLIVHIGDKFKTDVAMHVSIYSKNGRAGQYTEIWKETRPVQDINVEKQENKK